MEMNKVLIEERARSIVQEAAGKLVDSYMKYLQTDLYTEHPADEEHIFETIQKATNEDAVMEAIQDDFAAWLEGYDWS